MNGQDPETLDPALLSGLEGMRVARSLFEGLTRLDPKTAEAIPGLAAEWEISEEGRLYTFHLREGLSWSDGAQITSSDLKKSWLRLMDPSMPSPYGSLLEVVQRTTDGSDQPDISTPDDQTLIVRLNHKRSTFP